MAFVNRQGGAERHETSAVAGEPIDFDPTDESIVKVHYDLSAWNFEQHAELAEALAEDGIPHAWDGDELVVPEYVEAAADAVFERLEESMGPFPVALEDDAEVVEFGLDEWSESDRTTLTDAIVEAEIPHRWEGTTLVVAADAEESVDDLLDAIESGELMSADAESSSYARDGILGDLFVNVDKLARDPSDAKSRRMVIELSTETDAAAAPYALAPAVWTRIVGSLDELVAAIGAEATGAPIDAGDDDTVVGASAKQLSALLRQYV